MKPSNPGIEHEPQFLTFQLHDGTYGIAIESVSEIRAIGRVTPLPGSPSYVRGIMNLRGAIVPVIDLRSRLGLPLAATQSRFAVTIITRHDNKSIGLIADGVNEVVTIPKSTWHNTKALEHADQRFVLGLALLPSEADAAFPADSMIVLLNLDRLYDPALHSVPEPFRIDSSEPTTAQPDTESLAALHQVTTTDHSFEPTSKEITA